MAGNMTLFAFAAVTAFCWALAVQQLIDISCRAHSSKLARTLLQQSTAGSNRQTDTLP